MLKNKKIIGLLVGVCLLLGTIVILSLPKGSIDDKKPQDYQISSNDNTQNKSDETSQENSKTETSTPQQKTESSNKQENNQTTTKKETPTENTNQPQNKTEPSQPEPSLPVEQYVYLSIDCKTILKNMGELPEQYKNYVPKDGIILSSKKVKIDDGDTVFDVITKVTKMNKIQLSQSAGYVQSINNLPEKLFQGSGGWLFGVNGNYSNKGTKEYKLKNNDKVEWRYSCYVGDVY